MKDVRITVRLPSGLRTLIRRAAERANITSSVWVVNALRGAVAREQEEHASREERS